VLMKTEKQFDRIVWRGEARKLDEFEGNPVEREMEGNSSVPEGEDHKNTNRNMRNSIARYAGEIYI